MRGTLLNAQPQVAVLVREKEVDDSTDDGEDGGLFAAFLFREPLRRFVNLTGERVQACVRVGGRFDGLDLGVAGEGRQHCREQNVAALV